MPQLRLMKSIVERMKNLANMATLHITSEGALKLTVETDTVSVSSHFDGLHVEKQSNCLIEFFMIDSLTLFSNTEEEQASVTIELKRLSNFLSNEQLSPQRVVCGMIFFFQ